MEANLDFEGIKQSNLSAATIKVRDAVIQKCEGKDLEEMNLFVKQLLEHETNEQKRLGVLAARVYLLREKISFLLGLEFDDASAAHIRSRHSSMVDGTPVNETASSEDSASEHAPEGKDSEWMRVRILKDAEVNHVRFPAGVVIDALTADARKLIDAGKAEKISSDDDTAAASDDTTDAATEGASAEASDIGAETDETAKTAEAGAEDSADAPADTPDEPPAEEAGEENEAAGDDAEKS
ncbi:hypothetical protein AB8880_08270 [Alphaproteobacteria bacterium LSUCC0684]